MTEQRGSRDSLREELRDRFGLSKRDLAHCLDEALSTGADYADLYCETLSSNSISLEGSTVQSISAGMSAGCGVRVIRGETVGYASTTDFNPDDIVRAARRAAVVSDGPGSSVRVALEVCQYPNVYNEISVGKAEINRKREFLLRADRAARSLDPRICQVRVGCSEEVRHILIANSDGIIVSDAQPVTRMDVFCLARRGENSAQGVAGGGVRVGFEGLCAEKLMEHFGAEAARHSLIQLEARDAPNGEMEVVLGPGLPGILLHEAVGHGLEADVIRKGASVFTSMMGSRIGSPKCTVVDNGTLPGQLGTINVDDEGSKPQLTMLVENGILKNYLTDKLSARIMGMPSTGNGRRRNYEWPPMPRMTNTYMLPGDRTAEEILSSVAYGIFAKKFSGGQVDVTSGHFVFVASEAYLVENGRITAPLTNCALLGNATDILTRVSMVANDLQFDNGFTFCEKGGQTVPVSVGMPTVRVDCLTVGGTGRV